MSIPSPCFLLDEARLVSNLERIDKVQKDAGVEIILAFKGFSMWSAFPVLRRYIKGATASSLNEVKLCKEEMKTKAHTYCVAYSPDEFDEITRCSSHLTLNSLSQYDTYIDRIPSDVSVGLRVNPEWSDVSTDLYNPSSPISRLGINSAKLDSLPAGIEGLHFHVLCESDSYALEKVIAAFENRFGHLLSDIKWVNMGGGHLITRDDYDINDLISILRDFKDRHNLKIIL